jgi:hypothetical protein
VLFLPDGDNYTVVAEDDRTAWAAFTSRFDLPDDCTVSERILKYRDVPRP